MIPTGTMIEINTCPYCGNASNIQRMGERPYYECPKCDLVWQSPIPNKELLDLFYSSDAYRETRGLTPADIDLIEWKRANWIADYIGIGDSLLDIGCARGYLLKLARERGFAILGVEPHPTYTHADIPTVRDIDQVTGQWEVITCIHTLEHVRDLKHIAERIKELLAPGGLLIIEVPSLSAGGCFTDAHLYVLKPGFLINLFSPLRVEINKLTPHTFITFRRDYV